MKNGSYGSRVETHVALYGQTEISPSGCWLFTGPLMNGKQGPRYGSFNSKGVHLAHRVSWTLINGPIPAHTGKKRTLSVCHTCDVPSCINPAHLFLGTQKDNLHDMQAKGRKREGNHRGERNGNAKLSDVQVAEIRRLYADGGSPTAIGALFGVTGTQVTYIGTGRSRTDTPTVFTEIDINSAEDM